MSKNINSIEYIGINKDIHSSLNTFKHITIFEEIAVPNDKNIAQILKVTSQCKISEKKLVKTPRGTSFDGSTLSGVAMIVNLILTNKVDYMYFDTKQNFTTYGFSIPFSTNIIIPDIYTSISNNIINCFIDNMNCKKTDEYKFLFSADIILSYETY